MKPPPFEYTAPQSLDEALAALGEHGYNAKLLAGGQSLIPAMNFRLVMAGVLIDLNQVADLEYIRQDVTGRLRIGAMTRQRTLEFDPLVAEHAPLLHETMPYIAHPQIRNRGTIGGSLAHADPAAELPVIAIALDAEFTLKSAGGERAVRADDFFYGMFMVDKQPDEILTEISLPAADPRTGFAFQEVARRHGDYAMMGLAACVRLDESGRCDDAMLVYLNAGDRPVVAREAAAMLKGESAGEDLFAAVAEKAAQEEMDPAGSLHASPAYQRHLATVLTRRALNIAFERAASA